MAEQRDLERKAQLAAKEQEEMEQDARLETLRKTTRRRMGIGILRNKGEENQTAMLPTVASALKIREKVITKISMILLNLLCVCILQKF